MEDAHDFNHNDLRRMREDTGESRSTGSNKVKDYTLYGLSSLLDTLPALGPDVAAYKSSLLWESLHELLDRRGQHVLRGEYSWFYYTARRTHFDANWVAVLKDRAWIPGPDSTLMKPSEIVLESIDPPWQDSQVLREGLGFRPSAMDELASEFGLDPDILIFLKEHGVVTVADLKSRLGVEERSEAIESSEVIGPESGQPEPFIQTPQRQLYEDESEPVGTPSSGDSQTNTTHQIGDRSQKYVGSQAAQPVVGETGHKSDSVSITSTETPSTRHSKRGYEFISYIAVHADDEPASDGSSSEERMGLEEESILQILKVEPDLERTRVSNAGFDLLRRGPSGEPLKFVEVKAMTGTLDDRAVAISHTQFEYARKYGESFWLYIVESANDAENTHIVRIQNPAGSARSYTFDAGWRQIADVVDVSVL